MPSPFEYLPQKVIDSVTVYLPRSDLKSLRTTAKSLGPFVEPTLFGSITIAPYKKSLENLVDLAKASSGIGNVVNELIYDTRHLRLATRHNPWEDWTLTHHAVEKYNNHHFP